jgi:hypothetical protein
MNGLIAAMGGWLAADGIYSFFAYWQKVGQTWRDHWPRLIRALMGLALVAIGALNS